MRSVTESKIEKTIDEIREYIDNCKAVPLMAGKIMVNKDDLDELLDELESVIPSEIKQSQEIVAKYNLIIEEAENQARKQIDNAGIEVNRMLGENEILRQAYENADELVENARQTAQAIIEKAYLEADSVKVATDDYIDRKLQDLENLILATMQTNDKKFQDMQSNLDNYYQIVIGNRQELRNNNSGDDGDNSSSTGSLPANGATGEISIDMI